MTLVEFLLARIGEREDVARRVQAALGEYVPEFWDLNVSRWAAEAGLPSSVVVQISYAEPSRVLAECEAKRRIVTLCLPETAYVGWDALGPEVLAALALPYADHPDYDESWRP